MDNSNRTSRMDVHPVASTLILISVAMLLAGIGAILIQILGEGLVMAFRGEVKHQAFGNMGNVSTELSLLAYVLILLLYWFHFRRELKGFFQAKGTGKGIFLGWSALAISAFTLCVGILNHETYGSFGIALLLGLQPGISEEVLCRIIPISLAMRSRHREKLVIPVVVFVSLVFGLSHGINIFAGANPVTTLLQVIYSTGVGFVFAAIYMRTGNMWIPMFLHSLTDTIFFLGAAEQSSGGVLTQGSSASDAVILLLYGVLYFANGFYIFRRGKRENIPKVWEQRWNKAS